jgi:hypothetical protein
LGNKSLGSPVVTTSTQPMRLQLGLRLDVVHCGFADPETEKAYLIDE